MYLARMHGGGAPDGQAWLWALGALALYCLISYGLQYRTRARRGSSRPARDALHDLKDREEPQSPGQHFASRMIMLGGGALVGLVAFLTSGGLRVAAVAVTAVVAVTAWAFYDHRAESRSLEHG
ncbi:hypothetical protein [Streptomyces sp. NPDC059271]|uniref:hypothetical protein n=1 Tax=Streptomyces sp. NPDC059271 TaxID=3346799 RepID=UPI00367F5891